MVSMPGDDRRPREQGRRFAPSLSKARLSEETHATTTSSVYSGVGKADLLSAMLCKVWLLNIPAHTPCVYAAHASLHLLGKPFRSSALQRLLLIPGYAILKLHGIASKYVQCTPNGKIDLS